jgi:hypothetical protein
MEERWGGGVPVMEAPLMAARKLPSATPSRSLAAPCRASSDLDLDLDLDLEQ